MKAKNLLKSLALPRNPRRQLLFQTPSAKTESYGKLDSSIASLEESDTDLDLKWRSCVLEMSDLSLSGVEITQENSGAQANSVQEELEERLIEKEKQIQQLKYEKGLFAAQHRFNAAQIGKLAGELAKEREKSALVRRELGRQKQAAREMEARIRFLEGCIIRGESDTVLNSSGKRSAELQRAMMELEASLQGRFTRIRHLLGE